MRLLMPFIIILICVGMYFLYISPTWTDIDVLRAKASEYANVIEKSKELKDQRIAITAAFDKISPSDLTKLGKVIPQKFDPVLFANDINTLASRDGLTIKDLKFNLSSEKDRSALLNTPQELPSPTASATGMPGMMATGMPAITQAPTSQYKTYTASFSIVGSYEKFRLFLRDVESSLRLIDVSRLSVQGGGGSGARSSSNEMTFDIEVHTYALK